MQLAVDPASAVPASAQLRDQVTDLARTGELPPGERLPPVRRLAEDLGLAPGTVAKAYRELEQGGVVETRGRHGTFVVGPEDPADEARLAAREFARAMRSLGVAPDRALALARAALSTDR